MLSLGKSGRIEDRNQTMTTRTAEISRKTNETDIAVSIDLDGTGKNTIQTGSGFFDHMLEQL